MANITNIRLSARKVTGAGNNWDITVVYTATFTTYEWKTANFNFRDCFELWEEDVFSDDRLTGWVACSNFNPNAASVVRTLTRRISGDTLDTELGKEELYVLVRLVNLDLNITYEKKSPNLKLNP